MRSWNREGVVWTEQSMWGGKSMKANVKGVFGEKHELPIQRGLVYLAWTSSCFKNCTHSSYSAAFSCCNADTFSDNSRLLLRSWKTFFLSETILCCKVGSLKTTFPRLLSTELSFRKWEARALSSEGAGAEPRRPRARAGRWAGRQQMGHLQGHSGAAGVGFPGVSGLLALLKAPSNSFQRSPHPGISLLVKACYSLCRIPSCWRHLEQILPYR